MRNRVLVPVIYGLLFSWCSAASADENCSGEAECFYMGVAQAFAEVVRLDVKAMAITEPLSSAELDAIEPKIRKMAARKQIKYYRDENMLVTDLFPAEKTAGLGVFFLYRHDEDLDRYKKIKDEKSELVKTGRYSGNRRARINYLFGELLSYPNYAIAQLIASTQGESDTK